MEYRILGPLEVWADGEPVDLGPPKQRALLALLLLHVDRVVATDRILEELWGDDAPGKERALWVHISRLRSALEPRRTERGQSTLVVTRDHGYSLRSDPSTVDARRFEDAVTQARLELPHDPEGAAALLRDALALWRGSALQDFTYEPFAQAEITRLEELRLEALELRVDADLRRGLASELVAELTTLAHEHPLRERFVAQLMLAQYRAGRQSEALRVFQRHRHHVVEELGLEPSPTLRRLEEQILLHDSRLAPASTRPRDVAVSPFKGLLPFQEGDADDFFGRDRLVAEVIGRLDSGARLVTLVGPSGSGKSSVVRAGVVPAIRKGSLPESDTWLVASMVPGAHPFAELEAALLRAAVDAPRSLDAQLADPRLGLLRAALRVLPDDTGRIVLVIDQFEELFLTVEDDEVRARLLANLVAAVDDPRGRVVVVLTLRADCYERTLAHAEFARHLGPGVVNVVPLSIDELEEAAQEPAARHGVTFEPALLVELVTDVIGQPGTLPLFQYALTELFDRRDGDRLTLATYEAFGGVRGVLRRQADDVYHRLTPAEQRAAHQLFLRLVTITDHDRWTRRRVPAAEIVAMDVDVVTMAAVIDAFSRQRFLAFDRDHGSGEPTVEVAHEALLSEWDRLRTWIEDGRADIARRTALDAAVAEWLDADRDDDYLLGGKRLAEYARWREATVMGLTTIEREYLDASLTRRDAEVASEAARSARETGLVRRARRRAWAMLAVVAAVLMAGLAIMVDRPGEPPGIAMLTVGASASTIDDLMFDGLERASRDFGFEPVVLGGPFSSVPDEIAALVESGTDLVLFTDLALADAAAVASTQFPDTTFAFIDQRRAGVASFVFAEHEGAYLAGAAAALASTSGVLGFVGGYQYEATERFRAGFEAGARAIDPSVEVLAEYLAFDLSGFAETERARLVAAELYRAGADVVLHAAGAAGAGVLSAAYEQSKQQGRHLWAIGADADEYLGAPEHERPHVLTSVIKRFDVAVYEVIAAYLEDRLTPTVHALTLADGAVGYSTTGGHLSRETVSTLERLRDEILSGARAVPGAPEGALRRPGGARVARSVTVIYDGASCQAGDSADLTDGSVVRVQVVNRSDHEVTFVVPYDDAPALQIPTAPGRSNEGYTRPPPGQHASWCSRVAGDTVERRRGPPLDDVAAPLTPILAASPAADAERVARAFLDAYGDVDVEATTALLTPEGIEAGWGSVEALRLELELRAATGYSHHIRACAQAGNTGRVIHIRCSFDLHALHSEELGRGPYTANTWDIAVRDGLVIDSSYTWAYGTNGFSVEMWEPFADWLVRTHPDDRTVMYTDHTLGAWRLDRPSIERWEQRTKEWLALQQSSSTET